MKKNTSSESIDRRRFLKNTALTGVGAIISSQVVRGKNPVPDAHTGAKPGSSYRETLYNGIQLPEEWPPRTMKPNSYDPMPLPYLSYPPDIIFIDVGRQLFVDDFLIEHTDLKRTFHQPVKFEGNPLLQPETEVEMNQGYCPMAAPFSDGCFYDHIDKQ
ncbi:MAG: twin-arginine translocation signal domain-containing protein, partial [Aurantibacter sp.]